MTERTPPEPPVFQLKMDDRGRIANMQEILDQMTAWMKEMQSFIKHYVDN